MMTLPLIVQAIEFGKQWRRILAEFLATMMLIFFGCMSCIPISGLAAFTLLTGSLGFGLAAMISILNFGHISGALMNPFITVIMVIWEKMPVALGVAYVIAECFGAIAGYGLLVLLSPVDVTAEGICVTVPNQVNEYQALGIELMLSMALSLVNCSVIDPLTVHTPDSIPLKIGFTIVGLSIAGSAFSGGGMNPVRSLGPAVWLNRWESHWVYWVGPMVGGVLPAVFYKYVWLQSKEETKIPR